jgi:hypothetical protein
MGYIQQAQDILTKVKSQSQSFEKREQQALNLAILMLEEAQNTMTLKEKKIQNHISQLVKDPVGKAFIMKITDQCFRTKNSVRAAYQLIYLLKKMDVPNCFSFFKKIQFNIFINYV